MWVDWCISIYMYVSVEQRSTPLQNQHKPQPPAYIQFSRDLAALGFTADACNDAADALLAAVDERSQRAYWRLVKVRYL